MISLATSLKAEGISIHRRDCPNVQPDKPNVAERLIEVEWKIYRIHERV